MAALEMKGHQQSDAHFDRTSYGNSQLVVGGRAIGTAGSCWLLGPVLLARALACCVGGNSQHQGKCVLK